MSKQILKGRDPLTQSVDVGASPGSKDFPPALLGARDKKKECKKKGLGSFLEKSVEKEEALDGTEDQVAPVEAKDMKKSEKSKDTPVPQKPKEPPLQN